MDKWQEKCHIFSVEYELPKNRQTFEKLLYKTQNKKI
jgi:hypothetical protein